MPTSPPSALRTLLEGRTICQNPSPSPGFKILSFYFSGRFKRDNELKFDVEREREREGQQGNKSCGACLGQSRLNKACRCCSWSHLSFCAWQQTWAGITTICFSFFLPPLLFRLCSLVYFLSKGQLQ